MERERTSSINNAFYDELGGMWNTSNDHPIALLRAENNLRNPWIASVLKERFEGAVDFLDVGCGGGLLTNHLADLGHRVSGVDLSLESLNIAMQGNPSVTYVRGSAYELPFADNSFDAISAMDLLEHVEDPQQVIKEASRVLRPGGFFFFHTFNRNLLSYFMVIKGVDWCFSNAPKNMHVYPLFIKPEELIAHCNAHGLNVIEIKGVRPDFSKRAFWKMVFTRKVDEEFAFVFTPSLKTGYSGFAMSVR